MKEKKEFDPYDRLNKYFDYYTVINVYKGEYEKYKTSYEKLRAIR